MFNLFTKKNKAPKTPVFVSGRTVVTVLPVSGDQLVLWSDGSISSDLINAYLGTYKGTKQLVHNFFFADGPAVFHDHMTKEGLENNAYNSAYINSPFGQMLPDVVDAQMQAFSAVLVNDRFDPKSVRAIPDALVGRSSTTDIPAIIAAWKAEPVEAQYPTVLSNDWAVV